MTATEIRQARYTSIVDGVTTPVSSLRDVRGPKGLTASEADVRAKRARQRFETGANASRNYRDEQIASTLAMCSARASGTVR